ncbi:hypothetical protein ACLOJK_008609 [Asimina triloba]
MWMTICRLLVEIAGMESSEGKSNGGNKGNACRVKPSQGLKPAERLQSHTVDVPHRTTSGPAEGGTDPNPDSAFPTDVVQKCPAPKQIHSYFVKIRHYEDQEMKAETQLAENDIQQKNQEYIHTHRHRCRRRLVSSSKVHLAGAATESIFPAG